MGGRVILTPQAIDDLETIVSYIARDSSERARKTGNALLDAALLLKVFPERGRKVPEHDDPAVRELIHGAYRIIYEIPSGSPTIYILRFWHAARGLPKKTD